MWDDYDYAGLGPPKPFYRRGWFLGLVGVVVALGTAAVIAGAVFVGRYQQIARGYDLSAVEEMESASVIFDRDGKVLGKIFLQNREPVELKALPFELVQAVVAAEDARFFKHRGVDYIGMLRAAVRNYQAGKIRQGASTLTQQLARNAFALRERTYERKLVEAFLALEIERKYPKNRILELYLNRVYFGSGFYGVEAAAKGYFAKSARDLNLSEAAMLAGLLKSPNNLSPWSNRQKCVEARDVVLGRMLELGMIDQARYDRAVREALTVKNRRSLVTDSYALDMVRQQVIDLVGYEGAVAQGYRVHTSLDSALQKAVEQSVESHLAAVEAREGYEHERFAEYETVYRRAVKEGDANPRPPEYLQGAALVLDNTAGRVLALVGGRSFRHSQYNRVTMGARPAGTAFTPFVFAAAYENGLFPGALYDDSAMDNRRVMIGGLTGILGEWGTERADNRYEGRIPARVALEKGKNAATVRVGMDVGLDKVIAFSKRMGIGSPLRRYPATFLGSSEVNLAEMTLAYTAFAGMGRRPARMVLVTKIEEHGGRTVFSDATAQVRTLSATTAHQVHTALARVLEDGSGDKAFTKYRLRKFPLGGKTGTAYGFTDLWFLGYSSSVTCGVWVGFDKPKTIYRGAFSSDIALPIWVDAMNASFVNYPAREFTRPPGLERYEICAESGLLACPKCNAPPEPGEPANGGGPARKTTYFELAVPAQAPKEVCDIHGGGSRSYVQTVAPGEWPRAQLAVDTSALQPVQMKAPTIVGPEDPYGSVTVLEAATASANPFSAEANSGEKPVEVRRAEPVRALDKPVEKPLIELEPPPAMVF